MASNVENGKLKGGNMWATPDYAVDMIHTGGERGWEGEEASARVDQAPDILVCQIKIWTPKKGELQPAPKMEDCKLVLHEVESITVNSSYKQVIDTASVIIPKGSILKKVVTTVSAPAKTASNDEDIATELNNECKEQGDKSSDAGEVDGKKLFDPDHLNKMGVLITSSTEGGEEITPNMFATKDRIEIRVGYTQDPKVADEIWKYENHKCLNLVFSGYITGISPTSPIELKCEDLAYIFRTIQCPDYQTKGNRKVMDFFGGETKDKKKIDFLKGTDIQLHPDVKKQDISVGNVNLTHHLVVADVLHEWTKCGLACFMRYDDGEYKLSIGRTFMSTTSTDTADSVMYKPQDEGVVVIYSDWDVADDQLTIMNVDKNFIIIDAQAFKVEGGKNYHCKVSVRLNPDWDGKDTSNKYQFINEKDWTSTRKSKKKKDKKTTDVIQNKVDLRDYNRYPYISRNWNISKEDLKKEAIAYYESFNPSGVSGKLVLFGGRDIKTTDIIAFYDTRQDARSGFYLVEEVNTKFGVNGYRQEISLPYKIKSFEEKQIQK